MKRKMLLSTIIILIIGGILIYPKKSNKILDSTRDIKNSMLSIMVERETGTGNYQDASNYPSTGYYLNKKLSKCVNGSKISFSDGNITVKGNSSDRCYAYFDKDELGSICRGQNMAECFIKNYKKDSTIIYHDGVSDYAGMENYELEADDLSYRYTGATEEVKNYVCFGSDEENCPNDNLYRIIGLFKNDEGQYETKLIKADYVGKELLGSGSLNLNGVIDYDVNGTFTNSVYSKSYGSNEEKDVFVHNYRGSLTEINRYLYQEAGTQETKSNWPTALLNTIHLNHNFLNKFAKTWQEIIVSYKWHYKGGTWGNIAVASRTSNNTIKTTYDYEVGEKSDQTLTEPTKIGLMYASDYLYAASPNNWNKKPYNGVYKYMPGEPDSEGNPQGTNTGTDGTDYRSVIDENWMYMGLWEWTITQESDNLANQAFRVDAPGNISSGYVWNAPHLIRPCFYLISSVKVESGEGSKNRPYRLEI